MTNASKNKSWTVFQIQKTVSADMSVIHLSRDELNAGAQEVKTQNQGTDLIPTGTTGGYRLIAKTQTAQLQSAMPMHKENILYRSMS